MEDVKRADILAIEKEKQAAINLKAKRDKQRIEKEEKVKKLLDRMGESVDYGKEKAAIIQQEKDYIASCIQADEEAARTVERQKNKQKQMNMQMKQVLDQQVLAKQYKK